MYFLLSVFICFSVPSNMSSWLMIVIQDRIKRVWNYTRRFSSDDDDHDAADEDTEHRVFDWLIQEAADELGEGATYEDLQKRIRRKFADILGWHYRLRKHPVYKKVMATARDLHDGKGDYDWPEAYETAVEQRKFLLNRLVPRVQESADEDNV